MRIQCPWCGPRPIQEFHYGGDATKKRPRNPDKASAEDWTDYHLLRENPAGLHKEYWQHTGGCRSWLIVTRDTRTHDIRKVELADQPKGRARK